MALRVLQKNASHSLGARVDGASISRRNGKVKGKCWQCLCACATPVQLFLEESFQHSFCSSGMWIELHMLDAV
jgi:hypothetical protein